MQRGIGDFLVRFLPDRNKNVITEDARGNWRTVTRSMNIFLPGVGRLFLWGFHLASSRKIPARLGSESSALASWPTQ